MHIVCVQKLVSYMSQSRKLPGKANIFVLSGKWQTWLQFDALVSQLLVVGIAVH